VSPRPSSSVSELPFLLTVDEAAALLRQTPKAVYIRIGRGLMPGVVRDGRRVLIRRDDLLAYLSGKTSASRESPR
jgi:excisionase family DNA binding protein